MSNHSTPLSSTYDSFNHPTGDRFEEPQHEFRTSEPPAGVLSDCNDLLICTACGTQFDVEDRSLLTNCRICDDPRQYVPTTGQSFTSLGDLKKGNYQNRWKEFEGDDRFISIWTEPKFAIGQRCILIKTSIGNILWDCITYLDAETIDMIDSLGGLAAIIISHPHYYTTHLEWAATFDCPVYLSWEDKQWLNRLDRLGKARTFIQSEEEEIEIIGKKTGVKVLKLGGHFPGSLVALAFGRLLVADTLVTTPSGLGDWSNAASLTPRGAKRPEGMNSYAFMWSIPNMVPLGPEEISGMWRVLRRHDFESTHGAFVGTDVSDGSGGSSKGVKERILDSMQIQVRRMGWKEHAFLAAEL